MSSANELANNVNPRLKAARQFERLVFILALIGLVLTGIPQKFILVSSADWLVRMLGGIESTRILHRFFSILLALAIILHGLRIGYLWFVLKIPPKIFLTGSEWKNLFTSLSSNPRLSLKFEYLFMFIGLIILGITGSILINPILISDILPASLIPIARSLHSDHALLFVLVIIIWRIGVWFVWRPSAENIVSEQSSQAIASRRSTYTMGAGIAVVVIVAVIFLYANYETTAIDTVERHTVEAFSPGFVPDTGDAAVGELVWQTQRCAFCHGENAEGGINEAPALPTANLTFESFVLQVRNGSEIMPAFSKVELPDSYLVHLWAWISER